MSEQPSVPGPDQMRASNADRERFAKVLHDAMADGRLTVSEMEERLDRVYAAKTYGELTPLLRDLRLRLLPRRLSTSPRWPSRGH